MKVNNKICCSFNVIKVYLYDPLVLLSYLDLTSKSLLQGVSIMVLFTPTILQHGNFHIYLSLFTIGKAICTCDRNSWGILMPCLKFSSQFLKNSRKIWKATEIPVGIAFAMAFLEKSDWNPYYKNIFSVCQILNTINLEYFPPCSLWGIWKMCNLRAGQLLLMPLIVQSSLATYVATTLLIVQ